MVDLIFIILKRMARLGVKINLAIKLAFPIAKILSQTGFGWTSLKVKYIIEKCLISYAFSSEVCIFIPYKNTCVYSWHPTQHPDFTVAIHRKRTKYKYNNCKLRIYKDKISIKGDNYLLELKRYTNYFRGNCELFREHIDEIRASPYIVFKLIKSHTNLAV